MKKRLLTLLLICLTTLTLSGCNQIIDGVMENMINNKGKTSTINVDDIKSKDGIMFRLINGSWGLVCIDDDYWACNSFEVYYDGHMDVGVTYNLSGTTKTSYTLSDDDLKALYVFGYNEMNNPTAFEEVDACDGDYWGIYFYDENGEEHMLYFGYTYGIEELERIENIVEKYR